MMSEEEAQIQRALKLLEQYEGQVPGRRIRRMHELALVLEVETDNFNRQLVKNSRNYFTRHSI